MTTHGSVPSVVVGEARLARMMAGPAADLGIALVSVPSGAVGEVVLPVCRLVPVPPGSLVSSGSSGSSEWADWPEVFTACGVTPAVAMAGASSAPRLSLSLARSPSGQAVAYAVASVTVTGGRRVVVAPASELPEPTRISLTLAGLELLRRHRVVGMYRLEVAADRAGHDGRQAMAYRLISVVEGPDESGDWTLDGCLTGQYEQHLRAVLDLPLGDPGLRAPWTVTAWAYDQGYGAVYPAYRHVLARDPAIRIRLYGGDVPTGQALGLVAASGADLAPVLDRAEHAADYLTGVVTE